VCLDTSIFRDFEGNFSFIIRNISTFFNLFGGGQTFKQLGSGFLVDGFTAYIDISFSSVEGTRAAVKKLLGYSVLVGEVPFVASLSFQIYDDTLRNKLIRFSKLSTNFHLYAALIHGIGLYNSIWIYSLAYLLVILVMYTCFLYNKDYAGMHTIFKFYSLYIWVNALTSPFLYVLLLVLLVLKLIFGQQNTLLVNIRYFFWGKTRVHWLKRLSNYIFSYESKYAPIHESLVRGKGWLLSMSMFFLHINIGIYKYFSVK